MQHARLTWRLQLEKYFDMVLATSSVFTILDFSFNFPNGRHFLAIKSSYTTKTTKFKFWTTIEKPRKFYPLKFSTLTVAQNFGYGESIVLKFWRGKMLVNLHYLEFCWVTYWQMAFSSLNSPKLSPAKILHYTVTITFSNCHKDLYTDCSIKEHWYFWHRETIWKRLPALCYPTLLFKLA